MTSCVVEIRRCTHIKVNGTQCGSPALRNEKVCYFHQQAKTITVAVRGEDHYTVAEMPLPVFEDANSIQLMLRQVTGLLLQKLIDPKTAGLVLYALQIASSNLKRMEAEKPLPTQVVVDPAMAEETPLGMTQWSLRGRRHDCEPAINDLEKRVEQRVAEGMDDFGSCFQNLLIAAEGTKKLRQGRAGRTEKEVDEAMQTLEDKLFGIYAEMQRLVPEKYWEKC